MSSSEMPAAGASAEDNSAAAADSQPADNNPANSLAVADPSQNAHTPSAAGSVIEASDGISGGTLLIRIQNITATANLGVRLDLKKIALKCRNTEFNPRRLVSSA